MCGAGDPSDPHPCLPLHGRALRYLAVSHLAIGLCTWFLDLELYVVWASPSTWTSSSSALGLGPDLPGEPRGHRALQRLDLLVYLDIELYYALAPTRHPELGLLRLRALLPGLPVPGALSCDDGILCSELHGL